MAIVIQCPRCSRRYRVAEGHAGKQVQCSQCGGAFVAQAANPQQNQASAAQSTSLADVNLSALPAATAPSSLHNDAPQPDRVTNPLGGPTDFQMRVGSVGVLAAGLLLSVASLGMAVTQESVSLVAVLVIPLALVLGTAGLISPNVVRAIGKYGGHLSWRYKAAGFGALTLSLLLMALLGAWLVLAGFRPSRPGAHRRAGGRADKPGLTRPTGFYVQFEPGRIEEYSRRAQRS
jgi:predicted Zn finger-like uncharacterized protein